MLEADHKLIAKRARQATYRRRQRDGVICARVEVDATILGFVLKLGWITEADATSSEKIGEAISAGLRMSAKV